jgi:hypothetical protein
MKYVPTFLFLMLFLTAAGQAKKEFTKIFQFSVAPGISTNGIHPAGYSNIVSLNVTSGYSGRNYLFEIAGISNLNELETRGLQIAGLANLTGSNAFAGLREKEIDKKNKEGFEANLSGVQLSSLTNFVLNNVFGGQISGGFNVSRGALMGIQAAGISNNVGKYSFGVQVAGLYNVSLQSMDGVQVATVCNRTDGGLYGIQISSINKAGFMEGINSFENSDASGVQIGLINICGPMNGYQFGLVNVAKRMQGTQIGLINLYRNGKTPETRDGTSIGLINLGSSGYLSVYASEMFVTNVKLATGTVKNRRLNNDRYEKQIQNSLIYSKGGSRNWPSWAIGFGVKKFFFNRSGYPGYSNLKFFSYGVDVMHINHARKKITQELSLLARPEISVGSRFHPKNRNIFFFLSAGYNVYRSASGKIAESIFSEPERLKRFQYWPGAAAGILVQ